MSAQSTPPGVSLPSPPQDYSTVDQASLRQAITNADAQNFKRGQDVEIVPARAGGYPARLIMTDTVTGARNVITLASGVLTATPL